MIRTDAIVAFHGQQGSGKSALSKFTFHLLREIVMGITIYNLKDTFSQYALTIAKDLGLDHQQKDLLAYKELQKAISCWGEEHYDKYIWSRKYMNVLSGTHSEKVVITDDIRTPMNLQALHAIADEGRQVILFRLLASEEVRRSRCSAYRENAGYTELLLERPGEGEYPLGPNLRWVDINTELPKEESEKRIRLELLTK